MSSKLIVFMIASVAVAGGAGFYGGNVYATNKANSVRTARVAQFSGGQGRGGAASGLTRGGGLTAGVVLSKDANSLTLKLRDGGSKIIFVATSTRVSKMTDGALEDVAVGVQVNISGAANQDGSVTADSIQLRPQPTAGGVRF